MCVWLLEGGLANSVFFNRPLGPLLFSHRFSQRFHLLSALPSRLFRSSSFSAHPPLSKLFSLKYHLSSIVPPFPRPSAPSPIPIFIPLLIPFRLFLSSSFPAPPPLSSPRPLAFPKLLSWLFLFRSSLPSLPSWLLPRPSLVSPSRSDGSERFEDGLGSRGGGWWVRIRAVAF